MENEVNKNNKKTKKSSKMLLYWDALSPDNRIFILSDEVENKEWVKYLSTYQTRKKVKYGYSFGAGVTMLLFSMNKWVALCVLLFSVCGIFQKHDRLSVICYIFNASFFVYFAWLMSGNHSVLEDVLVAFGIPFGAGLILLSLFFKLDEHIERGLWLKVAKPYENAFLAVYVAEIISYKEMNFCSMYIFSDGYAYISYKPQMAVDSDGEIRAIITPSWEEAYIRAKKAHEKAVKKRNRK